MKNLIRLVNELTVNGMDFTKAVKLVAGSYGCSEEQLHSAMTGSLKMGIL